MRHFYYTLYIKIRSSAVTLGNCMHFLGCFQRISAARWSLSYGIRSRELQMLVVSPKNVRGRCRDASKYVHFLPESNMTIVGTISHRQKRTGLSLFDAVTSA